MAIIYMKLGLLILSTYLGIAGFFLMPKVQFGVVAKRIYKEYPYLAEPVQLLINDDLFIYTSPVGKAEYAWKTIKKVAESNSLFVMLHITNVHYVLPKRAFPNAETIDLFKTILTNHDIEISQ
ncbi:YcxB family protein [Laspinema sp. A4]|uniref:YcxB family protein n=1 Tax=Laspinema sp. D2d TaxID=2953686 RepID=UPI0021BA47A8|nr:YcxB family protein [Laspinema sp. D2d]MCT7984930.1 YcxB family protein [Laspinema sp. D2d]